MNKIFLLVAAWLALLCPAAPARVLELPPPGLHVRQSRHSEYRLFVPRDAALVSEADTLPLVVLLPATDGTFADVGARSSWGKRAEASGFVLLAPVTRAGAEAAIADALRTLPLDPNRLFIVGGSVPGVLPAAIAAPPGPPVSSAMATYHGASDPNLVWEFFERHPFTKEPPKTTRLSVLVTDLKGRGVVLVSLFDKKDGFPDGKSRAYTVAPVTGSRAEAHFDNLPPGEYAAVVLHDENNNGKMDTTLGIPREGFGATNGASERFNAPRWAKARFYLAGDKPTRYVIAHVLYLTR